MEREKNVKKNNLSGNSQHENLGGFQNPYNDNTYCVGILMFNVGCLHRVITMINTIHDISTALEGAQKHFI